MSTQIRTGVIRVEVGDNKPLYDTHVSAIISRVNIDAFSQLETSYWNRTNINCFEDRCTNRYAKDAISGKIYLDTNEETRTLMPQKTPCPKHGLYTNSSTFASLLSAPLSGICFISN